MEEKGCGPHDSIGIKNGVEFMEINKLTKREITKKLLESYTKLARNIMENWNSVRALRKKMIESRQWIPHIKTKQEQE